MPGWFDLYDWPVTVGAKDDRPRMLKVGVAAIQAAVDTLVHDTGLSASSIVVGGFSQGGAIALLAAYHPTSGVKVAESSSLAGCASLSGWLTLIDDFIPSASGAKPAEVTTPLFWGHGTGDDNVLFDHQAYGVVKLRAFGVKSIEAKSYDRMGHTSDPDELAELANFVDRVIFGTKDSESKP